MTCKDWINIFVTTLTIVGPIAIAAFAYVQAQKITFFETYFAKKSQAYENFISSINVEIFNIYNTQEKIAIARLYTNSEVCDIMSKFSVVFQAYVSNRPEMLEIIEALNGSDKAEARTKSREIEKQIAQLRNEIIKAMYNDLENCRKFKFNESTKRNELKLLKK